jgi:hypothetical protein
MVVAVALQNGPEEGAADGQNHLVCLHLILILTGKSHVKELLVLPDIP